MQNNYLKVLFILFLLSIVSGCQIADKKSSKAAVEDVSLNALEQQNLQITKSIRMLEMGENQAASVLIEEVLQFNPRHPTANFIKLQLESTTQSIFKTERLQAYRVKSGDTLGKIADEWLGNTLYFVTLAKLNHIKSPLSLRAGRVIKIPVIGGSNLLKKEQQRSTANLKLIDQYFNKSNFIKGLSKANTLFLVSSDLATVYAKTQQLLYGLSKSMLSISQRESMIADLLEVSKSSRDENQQQLYQQFITTHQRQLLLDESRLLIENEDFVQAAEKLIQANRLPQSNNNGSTTSSMQGEILDRLHEQAVMLYRNHSLQQAMDRWSLVLQLEPDNELAKKYTQRTQKLLNKLNQY